jgi:hypothetical protein
MRNPPEDAPDRSAGRRRGHRGSPSGSHRGSPQGASPGGQRGSGPIGQPGSGQPGSGQPGSGQPGSGQPGSGQSGTGPHGRPGASQQAPGGTQSSVFAPGYDNRRDTGSDRPSGNARRPAGWLGSAPDGAAGKGPVRGFPPLPGQPLPMYPPGQFSAWNRSRPGPDRPAGAPNWQEGRPSESARPPGSAYYGQDAGGYSMLAVSDPAADVTSTQTWQAVGDGRATGTWTSPFRDETAADRDPAAPGADSGPSGSAAMRTATGPRRVAGPGGAGPALAGPQDDTGSPADRGAARTEDDGPGRRLAPWSPQVAAQRAAGGAGPSPAGRGRTGRGPGAAPAAGTGDGVPVAAGPGAAGATAAGPDSADAAGSAASTRTLAPAAPGAGRPPGSRSGTGSRRAPSGRGPGQKPRRSGARRYPRSALLIAVVLVLAAGGALYLGARLISPSSHKGASPEVSPTAPNTPTPTPSPSLGQYGHIGSRQTDPVPVTVAELYPVRFTGADGGGAFSRTAVRLSKTCTGAVVGSSLQSAIGSAGCTQAARASYLSGTMMGTIGVFNLRTAKDARAASRAAGTSNFVSQLAGRKGPTAKLGHGNGVEESVLKGHYLILIWAEFTSHRTPKTRSQQRSLENFMYQLWLGTANVSLSNRMLTGSPT